MPVFRRDVLWYGDVLPGLRPSDSPSVRPSVRESLKLLRYKKKKDRTLDVFGTIDKKQYQ